MASAGLGLQVQPDLTRDLGAVAQCLSSADVCALVGTALVSDGKARCKQDVVMREVRIPSQHSNSASSLQWCRVAAEQHLL